MKRFFGVLGCMGALWFGATAGLMIGGFGMCAIELTWGLFFSALLFGGMSSGIPAAIWPKAWWAGALLFSLSAILGIPLAAMSAQWWRVVAIGGCILGTFAVAFTVGRTFRMKQRG